MKLGCICNTLLASAIVLSTGLVFAKVSFAQGGGNGEQSQPSPSLNKSGASGQGSQGQTGQAEAPKVNPQEEVDYKAFSAAPDADKKVALGQSFVQKYPTSRYNEVVYNGLVDAYYMKQDWKNFYATADQVVAQDPDDVDVLTVVGWVIPHLYNRDDPDAQKKLDKAESYEKHAIDAIPNVPKPTGMTDEQFAQAKAQKLAEAHSGLGLVYFRTQDFDNSVKELQQATQDATSQDPTDFYALGVGLDQLKRYKEAADAYQKCTTIPGSLQGPCKTAADKSKNQAAQSK